MVFGSDDFDSQPTLSPTEMASPRAELLEIVQRYSSLSAALGETRVARSAGR